MIASCKIGHLIFKNIAFILLFVSFLQAGELNLLKEIRLSKDQYQTIVIREDTDIRVLKFRWTLFAGDGLVMHLNYNGRASQFILYKHYKKDTYTIRLLPKISAYRREPYMYLVFKKFDHKKDQAYFDILIDDPDERALIELKES